METMCINTFCNARLLQSSDPGSVPPAVCSQFPFPARVGPFCSHRVLPLLLKPHTFSDPLKPNCTTIRFWPPCSRLPLELLLLQFSEATAWGQSFMGYGSARRDVFFLMLNTHRSPKPAAHCPTKVSKVPPTLLSHVNNGPLQQHPRVCESSLSHVCVWSSGCAVWIPPVWNIQPQVENVIQLLFLTTCVKFKPYSTC